MLAALHNLAAGVKIKTPPGSDLFTPAHFLASEKPRHRYTAAEVVQRMKAALSKTKKP